LRRCSIAAIQKIGYTHPHMSKVLIIFAQVAEATALLQHTKAIAIPGETARIWAEGDLPCRYQFDHGWIVISGVGVHAAQMAVAKYAHLCDEVWNFGLAGALREGSPLGEISQITKIGKYTPLAEGSLDLRSQECLSFILPDFILEDQEGCTSNCMASQRGAKLISSDFPIHDPLHRDRLGKGWDLVDMEGYGIAFATAALRKKCRMGKIVSDFATPGGRELIRKHKAELSEKIADKVINDYFNLFLMHL
jgi:nucleoside phosphorylase